jgi:UDP-N-acetylmuramate--alanine ligase
VPEILVQLLQADDLVLVQGAGNIGKIAKTLAAVKLQPQKKEE